MSKQENYPASIGPVSFDGTTSAGHVDVKPDCDPNPRSAFAVYNDVVERLLRGPEPCGPQFEPLPEMLEGAAPPQDYGPYTPDVTATPNRKRAARLLTVGAAIAAGFLGGFLYTHSGDIHTGEPACATGYTPWKDGTYNAVQQALDKLGIDSSELGGTLGDLSREARTDYRQHTGNPHVASGEPFNVCVARAPFTFGTPDKRAFSADYEPGAPRYTAGTTTEPMPNVSNTPAAQPSPSAS